VLVVPSVPRLQAISLLHRHVSMLSITKEKQRINMSTLGPHCFTDGCESPWVEAVSDAMWFCSRDLLPAPRTLLDWNIQAIIYHAVVTVASTLKDACVTERRQTPLFNTNAACHMLTRPLSVICICSVSMTLEVIILVFETACSLNHFKHSVVWRATQMVQLWFPVFTRTWIHLLTTITLVVEWSWNVRIVV